MINEKSTIAVKSGHFSERFCRPLYSSYCFSKIPETIKGLLGLESKNPLPKDTYEKGPFDHVIFIFLDGFGWSLFKKYQERIPFLHKRGQEGIISVLTSMFPSTTAAHVTCMHTGLGPSQSGIYEWFQYEPQLEAMIAPLLYSFARHKNRPLPLEPKSLYPTHTFYQTLSENGVSCFALQPTSIVDSVYSQTLLNGATVQGYDSLDHAFEQLSHIKKDKTYRTFYFPDIDSIAHREGTQAPELFQALETVCAHIEKVLSKLPPKTAVLITADHGLIDVSPKKTYYLNKHIPNIEKYLLSGQDQKPLIPAGSCRDFFLHVKKDNLEELREILGEFLKGKGEIYSTLELIEKGLFGPQAPSETFLNRVGNLVILPFAEEAVWWFEKGRFQQNFHAAHGGLTPEEMQIPFIFISS